MKLEPTAILRIITIVSNYEIKTIVLKKESTEKTISSINKEGDKEAAIKLMINQQQKTENKGGGVNDTISPKQGIISSNKTT